MAETKREIQKRLEELGLTMSLATEVLSIFSADTETGLGVALSRFDTLEPDVLETTDANTLPSSRGTALHGPGMLAGSNRYEEQGVLGIGGMGMVLRVRDLMLARTVAMKVLHEELRGNASAELRFLEEAQVGAQMQHPNLVPVYDVGRHPDGSLFFTMQEIRGRSLRSGWGSLEPGSESRAPLRWLVGIFHQICEAVAFAHSRDVIHRDLKPDNVMLGDFGEVLVVDWGIAKVLGQEDSALSVSSLRNQEGVATRGDSFRGSPLPPAPPPRRRCASAP